MRFSRIFIPIILILIGIQALSAASLRWDRIEADLEMTPEQENIRASFNVTNEGEERIRISRIKTSCGCTGSIIDRKILEPGDSTEIIATFNKGKRQGMNRNQLDVFIDSQPDPVATLRMNVKIPRLIDAMPQIVYWTPTGNRTERAVRITLDERYVDEVTKIEFDQTKLDVVQEADPEDRSTLRLKITPKSYDNLYRGTIMVHAKGSDGRKAEAKIMTFVQPPPAS